MHLLAEPKLPALRLGLLRYAAVAAVVLLATGFWQLQVVRSDHYAQLAERNRIRTLPIMAPRGVIFDRHGRVLVDHYPSFSVLLVREHVQEIQDSLPVIARGLSLDPTWLEQHLEKFADAAPYQPIVLKEEASLADIAFVEAHRTDLPELELMLVYRRRYPPVGLGAHLFGYVGEATKDEIERLGVPSGTIVGKMGLERHYDQILGGQDGERRVIVDSRGKEVSKLDQKKPVPGQPVRLTIDYDLQVAAEHALEGRQGALVALDPRTGDILAFVSRPAFDPNLFALRISPEDWQALTEDPAKPLLNRVIQAQLAPGSVFKVIVAAAALEEGLFRDGSFRVYCPGWANHYGRVFRCWRPEGHGTVELHRAVVESCDVFFYQVGRWLGIERIARYAKLFGLGTRTGLELPGEKAGLVPTPEWKLRAMKEGWIESETISVAIGQGPVLVTPLQLAWAVGGIASGGLFAQPRLLLDPPEPTAHRRVPLKAETVDAITQALWGVVNEEGTGKLARLPEIDVAGKTGTAQLVGYDTLERVGRETARRFRDNAWFIALAPHRNPEIVVAVLLEHGEHGAAAAPLAREVIRAYYEKKPPAPKTEVAQASAAGAPRGD
ncbi:MAG: penicillin-binding protein 2 [Acidobacteria bacterium]|nr:penicillin-binding protein 2 [Acidobacteriota bacterium]